MKIITIIKAWNEVFKGITTKEHKRRAKICKRCDYATEKPLLKLIKDELKEINGLACMDCGGCPLIAKIRGEDICRFWKIKNE